MRISLDIDGCMYKWSDTARWLLNHHFGYELGESTHWDYIKDNIDPEHWRWLWTEGIERGLFRYGHLYKGTAEAIDTLSKLGRLLVITSRPSTAVVDTLHWLSYNKFPIHEVHIIGEGQKKSDIPHADIYIDDSPDNIQDLLDNTNGVVCWQLRPWNVKASFTSRNPGKLKIVQNWSDFIHEVKREYVVGETTGYLEVD